MTWKKSSHSTHACVEVAATPYFIGIRDTKYRAQGHLAVSPKTWHTFLKSTYVTGS